MSRLSIKKARFSNFGIKFSKITVVLSFVLMGFGCKGTEPAPITPPVVTEPTGAKQYDTPFTNVPETADILMYEVNLSAFSATGNLKGVQSRLDSVKNLGVNVLWLMPIYPIGDLKGIGSPYAVKNYTQVNSAFGNLEDLRLLVKEAHKRNMAVILDWVANHTSWDNPWIQNSSWYAKDASGAIISPPGMGWNDVAELNFTSTAMRKEMIKAMNYWVLEANIDGFRCDHAEGVPTDFWKEAIDALRAIPNRKLIMFAETGKKELLTAGFDMIFGWDFYTKLKDVMNNNKPASELLAFNATNYNNIAEGKHILRWITNHDDGAWDDSPINIFKGQQGALAAFTLTSYMGGVPLIYNGQEVGFTGKLPFFSNNTTKIDWTINPTIWAAYKKLMAFRNSSNAVKKGTVEAFNAKDVVIFKKKLGSEEVLVLVNVRNSKVLQDLPSGLTNTSWKNAMTNENVNLNTAITLEPYSYMILKK
jgi:glycosidase